MGVLKAEKTTYYVNPNVISSFSYKRETEKHRSCLHMKIAKQILNNYTQKTTKMVIAELCSRSP
jgi:hypothetical protein